MANNVDITPGTGKTVHADEYTHSTLGAGVSQLVKLVDGTLDSSTAIASDIGTKTNALRTAPASDITDATYIGDIKFGEALPAGNNNIGDVDVFSNTAKDGSGTRYQPLVDTDGHSQVDVLSSALPSGAATSANQDTIIGHLDGVEGALTTIDADTGNISTKIDTLAGAVSGTEVQVDVLTMPTTTVTATDFDVRDLTSASDSVQALGNVAHDAADSGNPVKVGGKAVSSEPSAVSASDRTNLITDLVGKLITLPYANPENFVSGAITTAMTATTSTSLLAAPGSGLRNYITTIIVSNAHATVGTDVIIQDGSGGTTLMTIPAAAVYGGAVINLPVPLRQPTANTALYCANVTTGASTKVSVVGYKGA